MPVPPQRDTGATRAGLERWFAERGAGRVTIGDIGGPASTGYSHETLIFEARHPDGRIEPLVARIAPTRYSIFPSPDLDVEHSVMRALAERTDVPMPRVNPLERDASYLGAPFFTMDRIDGQIPDDNPPYTFGGWLAESTPAEQARIWWAGLDAMARVHRVDHAAIGITSLRAGLDAELTYWEDYLAWLTEPREVAPVRDALAWLRPHRPEEDEHALCWGDSRLGNQMFRDGACVAVLDWEMALIADPVIDLGWFLYFDRVFSEGLGVARPAGFPSHTETIARWEALTGRRSHDLPFYHVLAGVRFALVMMRMGQMLVLFERLPADSDFGVNNFVVDFLGRMLDEAGAPAGR